MSQTTCPTCNSQFDASQSLCPKCLLMGARPVGTPDNVANALGMGGATRSYGSRESSMPLPKPGDIDKLFPELDVLDIVGHGGMGVVYKARQKNLGREVALKLLSTALQDDPAFAERFTREARAMAKMNHPNIIAIHDFGQRGSFNYLVMEYVDGLNLRQLIKSTKVEPAEAMQMVPQLCDALQYAHDRGIVHRDIKPENVMISQEGFIKIADFGLAKMTGNGERNITLTQSRQVMGTLNYMAPEQVEHPTDVDHRADIYSLGVVIYELLTGELPLGRFAPPSQKVNVDSRLDEVVLRALEKEPSLRYQQASEFKTGMQSFSANPILQKFGGSSKDQELAGKVTKFTLQATAITCCILGGLLVIASGVIDQEYLLLVGFGTAALGALIFTLIGFFQSTFSNEAREREKAAQRLIDEELARKQAQAEPLPNYLVALKLLAMVFFFACPIFFIASGFPLIRQEFGWSRDTFRLLGIISPITGACLSAIVAQIAKLKGYRVED